MKIIHVCLACFYVEGMGYQENILPKNHSREGHNVTVITSDFAFNTKGEKITKDKECYINNAGVTVKVIQRKSGIFFKKFGAFDGLYNEIACINPDIIFVHGGQFISLRDIIKYKKKHTDVRLYIDQHGDFYNMPLTTFKSQFIQKVIYGHYLRKAVKYCNKFWGVTPWRCQYLHEVYGIPKNKIGLLVMGGDDDYIDISHQGDIRKNIRNGLHLSEEDFVLITGGKIDKTKNIHYLMQAIKDLNINDLKLIVFGQPNDEMETVIEELSKDIHIKYIGWLPSTSVYDYFLASDLAVFPGTHSVLWEQAAACGIPLVVNEWEGMHHIDIGGNCKFLKGDDVDELKYNVENIYRDKVLYQNMLSVAKEKGVSMFSYRNIAKRAIEEKDE